MPNREYWRKRAEWMGKQLHRGENVPVGRIMRLYRNAFDAIDADIRKLEAAKAVSRAELEAITRDLNRIALSAPDMIRQNHVLKNILSYQYRIDRAQWVKARAYTHLMKAAGRAAELVKPTLAETYKAARYGTLDDIAMGLNCGVDFSLVPERTLNRILEAPFHGKNYVQSIWDNMEEAAGKAQKIITEGMVKGAGYPQMARSLAKITNNTYYNAYRLVQTEITHFTEQGRMDAYRELGIERYTYYATLGAKTCDVCAALDGKSFELDRAMEGKNLPPIHPHCMCYTVVGDVRLTSRTARNPLTGENYKVRGDMTYQEWKESLTGEERMAIKAYRNRHSDSKQYERYKERLGEKNTPKSFDLFQKMKYNEPEKWELLKDYYESRGTNMISAFTTFDDYMAYKGIIGDKIIGLVTVDGVEIKGQSKHFIERVFGTSDDPYTNRPRDGVEIEDIKDALIHGTTKHRKDSLRYFGSKCKVSVNGYTGTLIQTNPV